MQDSLKKKNSSRKAWYIVFISALMGCTIAASFPQASMTITALSQKTGMTEQLLLSGDTLKSAAIVIAMLLSGPIYKRFGTRTVFIFSLMATAVPQFVLPYIDSPVLFFTAKFVQGLASLVFPVFLLLIMEIIENKNIGLATAIFNGIFYSGGGIGGTIAGILIAKQDWIFSYFGIGILQLLIGILWLITVKVPAHSSMENPLENISPATSRESKWKLFTSSRLWLLILAFLSTTFVIQAITIDIPLFSQFLGYNNVEIGKLSTAVTMGMLISCLVSGKISDILTSRAKNKGNARVLTLSFGTVILMLSSLLLIFLDLGSFSLFYVIVFFFSFGASWGLGTFYCILPEFYNEKDLPIITGIAGGAGDLGMPFAPFIVGIVFGVRGLWDLGWFSCTIISIFSLIACIILYTTNKTRIDE